MVGRGEKRDLGWGDIVCYLRGSLKKKIHISFFKKQFIKKEKKESLEKYYALRVHSLKTEKIKKINLVLINCWKMFFTFTIKVVH